MFRLIAHRGAPLRAVENTLASFEVALSAGAQYIELDVHVTSDQQLVVHHDPQVKTPHGVHTIAACTYTQIAAAVPYIPLLSSVLDLCAHKSVVYTEIKTINPAAVGLVHSAAIHTKCEIIVSSFHHSHVVVSKELNPCVLTMALLDWRQSVPVNLIAQKCVDEIGVGHNARALARLKTATAHGVPMYVYTVNDSVAMNDVRQAGFSGVFTDTY